jgi:ATP-dependent exoDNAse (exonuclease V) beta subunit
MIEFPAVARTLRRSFYESPTEDGLRRAIAAGRGGKQLRAEVRNERRFAVRDQSRLLCGSIDRLALVYDSDRIVAADVLDFKTDTVNSPERLSELVDHYRPQLEAYCQAVATMYRLSAKQITARLLFVSSGEMRCVRG